MFCVSGVGQAGTYILWGKAWPAVHAKRQTDQLCTLVACLYSLNFLSATSQSLNCMCDQYQELHCNGL